MIWFAMVLAMINKRLGGVLFTSVSQSSADPADDALRNLDMEASATIQDVDTTHENFIV